MREHRENLFSLCRDAFVYVREAQIYKNNANGYSSSSFRRSSRGLQAFYTDNVSDNYKMLPVKPRAQ